MNAKSLFNKIIVNDVEIDIDALDANNGIYQLPAGQKTARVKFKVKDKTTLPDVFYLNSQVKKIKMPEAMVNIPDYALYGTGIESTSYSYFTYFNPKAFTKRPIDLDNQYFGFSTNSIEVVDDNPEFPTFTNTNSFEVVFSSSDELVATINEQGEVTIVGNGTTLIKANFAGNETYKAKEASYTLVVNKPKQNINDEDFGYSIESITVIENGQELPTFVNTNNLPVTFTSSDETVATINEQGIVEIIANGTTTITATYSGDINYNGKEDSYTLIVNIPIPKDDINDADFGYSAESITVTEDGQELPALVNINNLEVVYSSSDTSVATINNQGEVSIVGNGTTTISATFEGNEQYNEKVASYTLVVDIPQLVSYKYFAGLKELPEDETANMIFTEEDLTITTSVKPTEMTLQAITDDISRIFFVYPKSWGKPVSIVDANNNDCTNMWDYTLTLGDPSASGDAYIEVPEGYYGGILEELTSEATFTLTW